MSYCFFCTDGSMDAQFWDVCPIFLSTWGAYYILLLSLTFPPIESLAYGNSYFFLIWLFSNNTVLLFHEKIVQIIIIIFRLYLFWKYLAKILLTKFTCRNENAGLSLQEVSGFLDGKLILFSVTISHHLVMAPVALSEELWGCV